MDRNIKVIFSAGLLSAFVFGVFELLFPLYLSHRGISLTDMGIIFSVSALVLAFFRIFLGEYTDVYGRKKMYLAASALSVISKSAFPFSLGKLEITINKFCDDLQDNLRTSVHDIMLFENARKVYAKVFSWFTASNFILQAVGSIVLAGFLTYLGYPGCFFILAGFEIAKFFLVLSYKESEKEKVDRRISLREAYSFKLEKNLMVLSLSAAVAAFGFGIAHGFLLPLYFAGKYGLDVTQISLVTAVHRLCFLTTPLADKVIRRLGVTRTYILSTSSYVVSFLAVGFFTFPIIVFLVIFLIHDLVGGGIRLTATNVILQNLTTDSRRGRVFNAYNAIQTFAAIASPSIAGILAAANWDYTFIAGGLLFVVSLVMFCLLFKAQIEPSRSTE